jgi:type IV pilus secretin PilQ/predicted competence protein
MERRHQRSLSLAALLAVFVAATITADVNRDEVPETASVVRAELRAISTRLDGARSQVLIEASEPVAYVTSQPDPLTVVVDLRNVKAGTMPAALGPLPPVSDVDVVEAVAGDGADVARVKIKLAYAAKHRVRSSRNIIYVEVDRGVVPREPGTPGLQPEVDIAGLKPGPAVPMAGLKPGPALHGETNIGNATALKSVRAIDNGIALTGDGRLVASSIEEAKDAPPRLLLDFPGISAKGVPAETDVRRGDIQRVRVGTNSVTPLVTRVVVDLAKKTQYRVEEHENELHVLFGDAAGDTGVAGGTSAAGASAAGAGVAGQSGPGGAGIPVASGSTPAAPAPGARATRAPAAPAPAAPVTPVSPATPAVQQPTAPPPPQPDPSVAAPESEPANGKFNGHPITLDFQGADLRSVLRTFADISGLNIVIDPTINGAVDVSLKDVPWDQALDIILKANKLGYAVDGTVVRIAPINILAQEEEERRKLTDAQALSGELRVLTIPLSYAKATDLVAILTRSALSARGEVQVDMRTNTLIVRDLADRLQTASELVKALDRPQPQVEIEARIVQTTRDFARALGVEWGLNGRMDPALGNTTPFAFPNNGSLSGRVGEQAIGSSGQSVDRGVNLRAPAATSALGIALGAVNGSVNLDVVLSQLESTGRGRLLSTPRVSTQNNVEAEMTQGVQIPIQTVANNTVTVNFKDAALTLKVTPQITASNTVIMRVFLENATPDFSRAVNGIPPIDTQRAVTTVLVADGETTVIGGIYVSLEQVSQDRVPLLHRVPLLGWLFKRDINSDESRELLIFITPRITRS